MYWAKSGSIFRQKYLHLAFQCWHTVVRSHYEFQAYSIEYLAFHFYRLYVYITAHGMHRLSMLAMCALCVLSMFCLCLNYHVSITHCINLSVARRTKITPPTAFMSKCDEAKTTVVNLVGWIYLDKRFVSHAKFTIAYSSKLTTFYASMQFFFVSNATFFAKLLH